MDKIEVKDEVKRFGKLEAVNHVSFGVAEGEVLSLLGPSGCGKTTVLRSIAGLDTIEEGEILLDGEVVTSPKKKIFVSPEKRHLGLIFQSYALWPHMTVYKNVAFGVEGGKRNKKEIANSVARALELVNLSGLEHRYPSQLSGGQQQRVAVARNLAYEPKVLLLDEPLSNLDLKERERMRGELKGLLKRIGITALYVTHDQEEAFVISDRVIVMKEGKIMQVGTPETIYEDPVNMFVAEFIGRANMLKARLVELDERRATARINVPDLGSDLMCKYECKEFPKDLSLILVRHNEMGLYESKPDFRENVFEVEVTSREYRGSITDHKVRVGNANLVVTTHRFCSLARSTKKKEVYLHIPPEAVKPIPCE
jgi:ABC-type Fe3+/spermidine/putrescine transport system ATPase subunit